MPPENQSRFSKKLSILYIKEIFTGSTSLHTLINLDYVIYPISMPNPRYYRKDIYLLEPKLGHFCITYVKKKITIYAEDMIMVNSN